MISFHCVTLGKWQKCIDFPEGLNESVFHYVFQFTVMEEAQSPRGQRATNSYLCMPYVLMIPVGFYLFSLSSSISSFSIPELSTGSREKQDSRTPQEAGLVNFSCFGLRPPDPVSQGYKGIGSRTALWEQKLVLGSSPSLKLIQNAGASGHK